MPNVTGIPPESGVKHHILSWGLVVMMIFAIFGNSMLFVTVYRKPQLRTRTNMFILNLAFADLCVAVMCMPFSIITCLRQTWIFGESLCQFNGFINILFAMCSLQTLTAISIEKYFAIVKPLYRVITCRRAVWMLAVTWLGSLFVASLPLMGFTRYEFRKGTTQCSVKNPVSLGQIIHASFVSIIAYLIPLSIMGFAYVNILKAARNHNRRISRTSISSGISSPTSVQNQIAFTVFIMLVVFLVCWTPYFVYVIYVTADHVAVQNGVVRDLGLAAYWCAFLNSSLNPYIYGLRNPQFKSAFNEIFASVISVIYGCCENVNGRSGSNSSGSATKASCEGSDSDFAHAVIDNSSEEKVGVSSTHPDNGDVIVKSCVHHELARVPSIHWGLDLPRNPSMHQDLEPFHNSRVHWELYDTINGENSSVADDICTMKSLFLVNYRQANIENQYGPSRRLDAKTSNQDSVNSHNVKRTQTNLERNRKRFLYEASHLNGIEELSERTIPAKAPGNSPRTRTSGICCSDHWSMLSDSESVYCNNDTATNDLDTENITSASIKGMRRCSSESECCSCSCIDSESACSCYASLDQISSLGTMDKRHGPVNKKYCGARHQREFIDELYCGKDYTGAFLSDEAEVVPGYSSLHKQTPFSYTNPAFSLTEDKILGDHRPQNRNIKTPTIVIQKRDVEHIKKGVTGLKEGVTGLKESSDCVHEN